MIRRSLEWFGGSVLVYVLAAACGSTGGSKPSPVTEAGMGGEQGTGGVQGAAGEGIAGERDGGIMNPVPDAMAAAGAGNETVCDCPAPPKPYVPPEPIVVEAECETQVDGSPSMWAVAEFPGKTAEELTKVRAMIRYPESLHVEPEGFATVNTMPYTKDGAVAVACGSVNAPASLAESVTFILH